MMQEKTVQLIGTARQVLEKHNPMTLRQVYYQLVSKHVIDNNRNEYQRLSTALVKARKEGLIPWEWIEDRTRKPHDVSMWDGLKDFMETVRRSYRRNIWLTQPRFVLVWLEKDALSGIFEEITEEYGVSLIVGRGYNSWSIRKDMADRIKTQGKPTTVLYFGDFDPSGEDICRDLKASFMFFGIVPEVVKVALTQDDVIAYNLPPDFTKKTDSRSRAFVERYGDMAVELDALSLPVLQTRIRDVIEANLDKSELEIVREIEAEEIVKLTEIVG